MGCITNSLKFGKGHNIKNPLDINVLMCTNGLEMKLNHCLFERINPL